MKEALKMTLTAGAVVAMTVSSAVAEGSGQNMVIKRPALKRLTFRQAQQPE